MAPLRAMHRIARPECLLNASPCLAVTGGSQKGFDSGPLCAVLLEIESAMNIAEHVYAQVGARAETVCRQNIMTAAFEQRGYKGNR